MRVDYFTEYSHSPAVGKAPETMDEASKVDLVEEDKKRSTVNIPKKPYTLQLFLMKDFFGKKKRNSQSLRE